MSQVYYESIQLIERLHRHFLDVLKVELERMGVMDINNMQAMILYNIGKEDVTVGELTVRGYYLGSNVSYNVKKMVENEYLIQERSKHDKRSIRVRLSEKGTILKQKMGVLFSQHSTELKTVQLDLDTLQQINARLRLLERFWAVRSTPANDMMNY